MALKIRIMLNVEKCVEEAMREAKAEESLVRRLCAEEVKQTLKPVPRAEKAVKLAGRGRGLRRRSYSAVLKTVGILSATTLLAIYLVTLLVIHSRIGEVPLCGLLL